MALAVRWSMRVVLALYSGFLLGIWILAAAGAAGAPLVVALAPTYNKIGVIVGILTGSLVGALLASLYRNAGPYPTLTAISMITTVVGLYGWIERQNLPKHIPLMPALGLLLMLSLACGPAVVALLRTNRQQPNEPHRSV